MKTKWSKCFSLKKQFVAVFKDQKEGIWNYFFEDGSSKAQAYYEAGNGVYKQFYN